MYKMLAVLVACFSVVPAALAQDKIPFEAALDSSAVVQDRLDDIHTNSLILGNGDINGLLYADGATLILRLTKNDVWDARIDTSGDPELTTVNIREGTVSKSMGSWYSWGQPWPCPRPCGIVTIGPARTRPVWTTIRGEGGQNAFEFRDGRAVMSITGKAEASNGWWLSPLDLKTDGYQTLRVRISGTPNAKFFVDLLAENNAVVLGSGWQPTPAEPKEFTFAVPPRGHIRSIVLYTWTIDGKRAENRWESVTLEGAAGKFAVDLTSAGRIEIAPCRARLDLKRAMATVEPGEGSAMPRLTVRALAGKNVFLIQSPSAPRLEPVKLMYKVEPAEVGGVQVYREEIPGDPDWPGMSFAVAMARQGELTAVAIVTSRESDKPDQAAVALAKAALQGPSDQRIAEHEKTWRQFWSASGVDLDATDLRDAWYRNLYFLRCVSKPGVVAPGLFASMVGDSAAWHGGHTINYNTQQTFWSAFATNHVELAQPVEQLVNNYLPRAKWMAKATYGCGGAFFPHNLYPYEPPDPAACKSKNARAHACSPWAHTIGNSGFLIQNLWWHYQYQPDRQYLEQVAYGPIREVASFYADFIDQCKPGEGGKVLLGPSVSPEHHGWVAGMARNYDGTFDIAFARFTFQAAIEAAKILGRDDGLARRFQAAMDKLPPYPTTAGPAGVVVDVRGGTPIQYNIAVPAAPVFPAEQVTWFSPEDQKKLFERTIGTLNWTGYNSSMILSVARARLSMPGTLEWVRKEFKLRSRPNGTITLLPGDKCGHFTEQFAASAAVSELLLQSVQGILRVFPCVEAAQSARFENLRAQGGFLVSAQRAGGQVTQVTVTSTVGGPLRLLSPWKAIRARKGGQVIDLTGDPRGVVEVPTQAGEKFEFTEK